MRRYTWILSTGLVLLVLAVRGEKTILGAEEQLLYAALQSRAPNLLVNGDFEELSFYHKPPNHFVGGGWLRWWIKGSIPEYDDVRAWRDWRYDGDHMQVYFRWWKSYTAGIYQQVPVQPCTFYTFQMWGRNHSLSNAKHHARIGIDPLGRLYNDIDNPEILSLPADIDWSPDRTYFSIWGMHVVTSESRSEYVTAITYASPDPGYGYYDTFWDAGSLVETMPPGGKLPEPESFVADGFVENLVITQVLDYLVVSWDTSVPASTQVWYSIVEPSAPLSPTIPYSVSVTYFPLVFRDYKATFEPQFFSLVDQTPETHHEVMIGPFQDGQEIQLGALSRRLVRKECRTSTSGRLTYTIEINEPIYRLYVPLASAERTDA